MPAPPRRPPVRSAPPAVHVALQYVGFQDTPTRREYLILAQLGEEVREFTVSIAREAFAKRKAMLQDGPDICYRKLMQALALDRAGTACLSVSDEDLARYRDSHAPPPRRPHARRVDPSAAEDPAAILDDPEPDPARVL